MNLEEKASQLGQAVLNAIVAYGEGDDSYNILINLQNDIYDILTMPTYVKIYSENDELDIPSYSTDGSVCVDLRANRIEVDAKNNKLIIYTGIHIALPNFYEAEIRPRSSITKTKLIFQNSPATIDYDYRGEIKLVYAPIDGKYLYPLFLNYINNGVIDEDYFPYKVGNRCAQLLIRNVEKINFQTVDNLSDLGTTERNTNGFGSTGVE